MKPFKGVYKGKKVLVTGHTGFKGSWLSLWLSELGAKVTGYSSYLPSTPCNFEASGIGSRIRHIEGDICDMEKLAAVFSRHSPEMVFHLAAQPLVRRSYREPKLTFDTNVGGTVNVLECIRLTPSVRAAVIITSDKCYRNVEWTWGYRENDALGGDDPYSASKACAELVSRSYMESFFRSGRAVNTATTRAGNVIGGGDWAANRVVPDLIRAWAAGKKAVIRNPQATRPWQHVLEPLSGYLCLGAELSASDKLHGEAFNFGPDAKVNQPVEELILTFLLYWRGAGWKHVPEAHVKESLLLKLSCDKALNLLGWHSALSFKETVRLTAEWYRAYYGGRKNMQRLSVEQINFYVSEAKKQGLQWTR